MTVTKSLAAFVAEYAPTLEKAGIDQAKVEIELILCHLLKVGRLELVLHGTDLLDDHQMNRFHDIVQKRATRVPLQYILGECWFYGRKFAVSPSVMVPTPETELLCDAAVGFARTKKYDKVRVLELGVGSGVIAVTVALELAQNGITPEIVALDISAEAIAVARKNAENQGAGDHIEFRCSDYFSALNDDERFDLILSNPPYIAETEYAGLPPEVLADPKIALTSGNDGLDAIKRLLSEAPHLLAEGGRIMFEIGYDQSEKVMQLTANDPRCSSVTVLKDLADIDRVIIVSCTTT